MIIRILTTTILIVLLTSCIGYDKDSNAVYYKSWNEGSGGSKRQLKGADPKTFKVLEHKAYAKDKQLVFYKGQPVSGADAATFESLGEFYARDKYRGYYGADSIKSSKGTTFKVIDAYYSTDGTDVFHTTEPLHVCSAKDFRFVYQEDTEWERWTTDGCYYYFREYKVPSDDYSHVQLFKGSAGFAKDKNHVYFNGRIINFNEVGKRIIDTVDVASFTVSNYLDCKDKFGCINAYRGREECDN